MKEIASNNASSDSIQKKKKGFVGISALGAVTLDSVKKLIKTHRHYTARNRKGYYYDLYFREMIRHNKSTTPYDFLMLCIRSTFLLCRGLR